MLYRPVLEHYRQSLEEEGKYDFSFASLDFVISMLLIALIHGEKDRHCVVEDQSERNLRTDLWDIMYAKKRVIGITYRENTSMFTPWCI